MKRSSEWQLRKDLNDMPRVIVEVETDFKHRKILKWMFTGLDAMRRKQDCGASPAGGLSLRARRPSPAVSETKIPWSRMNLLFWRLGGDRRSMALRIFRGLREPSPLVSLYIVARYIISGNASASYRITIY
jgi:hypothetical protein